MTTHHQHPRILVVAPEVKVTLIHCGFGSSRRYICARAGGMGDICSAQVHALYERGVDIRESSLRFSFEETVRQTIGLYKHMLKESSSSLQKASDLTDSVLSVL